MVSSKQNGYKKKLFIDYRLKENPNYIGSFKGFFDKYSIYRNNVGGVSIFYSESGNFYSNTNFDDINQWLDSLGYPTIK